MDGRTDRMDGQKYREDGWMYSYGGRLERWADGWREQTDGQMHHRSLGDIKNHCSNSLQCGGCRPSSPTWPKMPPKMGKMEAMQHAEN